MTTETTGGSLRERAKLQKDCYQNLLKRDTIEAMKQYFGVESYVSLFRSKGDVDMDTTTGKSSSHRFSSVDP